MNKSPTLSDVLRKAIDRSGLSLYRIAKGTGITSQSLLRFRRGDHSMHLSRADALAAYLRLRLVPDPDAVPPEPTPENLARPMLMKPKTKRKAKRPARRRVR
jgi:transcriptional regulator with XRE-family HTH domain